MAGPPQAHDGLRARDGHANGFVSLLADAQLDARRPPRPKPRGALVVERAVLLRRAALPRDLAAVGPETHIEGPRTSADRLIAVGVEDSTPSASRARRRPTTTSHGVPQGVSRSRLPSSEIFPAAGHCVPSSRAPADHRRETTRPLRCADVRRPPTVRALAAGCEPHRRTPRRRSDVVAWHTVREKKRAADPRRRRAAAPARRAPSFVDAMSAPFDAAVSTAMHAKPPSSSFASDGRAGRASAAFQARPRRLVRHAHAPAPSREWRAPRRNRSSTVVRSGSGQRADFPRATRRSASNRAATSGRRTPRCRARAGHLLADGAAPRLHAWRRERGSSPPRASHALTPRSSAGGRLSAVSHVACSTSSARPGSATIARDRARTHARWARSVFDVGRAVSSP